MNIPNEILQLGLLNELIPISTGGGVDYLIRNSDQFVFVLADPLDAGSPDTLDSPADICMYAFTDEYWLEPTTYSCLTVSSAISLMSDDIFLEKLTSTASNLSNLQA